MIKYDDVLRTFYSTKINDQHYFSGFGTKALGDARSTSNIQNFFSQNSVRYKTLITLEQIHSSNVTVLDKGSSEQLMKIEETDGVITNLEQNIITVQTGDCIPIIFVHKKSGIIGISHQGWRGSLKRLQQKMVKKMAELGADKSSIVIAIGPSINDCCYHIEEERYYDFLEEFNGYSDKIFYFRGGKRYLNLPLLNSLLLKDVGIKSENIDFFPFCTSCDKDRFFSYRRDKGKEYGEMASFILKNQ